MDNNARRALLFPADPVVVTVAAAHGKQILCVSPDWWSFSNLPTVRCFKHLEPAIECLIATAAGIRARELYSGNGHAERIRGRKQSPALVLGAR
jgi:hypothetical protein